MSKEITDLKTEIGVFKRKGGHIYTMVTSNKKNLGYNEVNKNLFWFLASYLKWILSWNLFDFIYFFGLIFLNF